MSDENGKTWWRNPEGVAADPAATSGEFPPGADQPPGEMSRRTMLLLMGSSLSLAGLAACRRPVEKIVPYVDAPEEILPGVPRTYATTMPFGRSAYGILVESHEGRPTKIEGNELHPSTSGASASRIQAEIYQLYDPDRSRSVLQQGQPATWADFEETWASLREQHLADGGRGLAVLSTSFASPTVSRLRRRFLDRFPNARWASWEPVSDENVLRGVAMATGKALEPLPRFERAEVILALESDFLATDPENVRHARAFADGRRVLGDRQEMNRLYVVESTFSATGAVADHRLALESRRVGALLFALAKELGRQGVDVDLPESVPTPDTSDIDPEWIAAVARDLAAKSGKSLVVAGAHQPVEVHAAVAALNEALGGAGRTVTYHDEPEVMRSGLDSLVELTDAMSQGSVRTLILLGGNPVYDAPADLELAEALKKVETSIRLGFYVDETSKEVTWHLPEAHFLEAWGDARSVEGTLSVVQPLIQPLFEGRSTAEVLSLLESGQKTAGHDLVRETWTVFLGTTDFENRWNRVLHDGLLRGSDTDTGTRPSTRPEVWKDLASGPARAEPASPESLEVRFVPSPAVHDGRFANNAWLQELPDPVTKLTWDNAAVLSPATARRLGIRQGDVVRLSYRERTLEIPAFPVPGQAEHSVTIALGYGRTAAGRTGNGVGVDAYRLRTSKALSADTGLTLTPTGERVRQASTQEHWSLEGRPHYLEAPVEEYRKHPELFEHERPEHPPLESLWAERDYDEGHQWGMSIDLNACVGCNACVTACQAENNIPVVGKDQVARGREMHWIRIDRYFSVDDDGSTEMVFQPVTCMHCENAPCEQVCPVAATVHDSEGLNVMVYNRCIGTRYCSNNCPYKVRRFNFYNLTRDTPELLQMANNPDVTIRSRGVMEKCTYCLQRINKAKLDAKMEGTPLRDGDVRTACQQACPAGAIEFGDVRDPESVVASRKREKRDYAMLEELNTKPRTTYLANLRNPNPELGKS